MNQIKQWLESKKIAEVNKPKNFEQVDIKGTIDAEGGFLLQRGVGCVGFSYDEGLLLREWLNRIYTNGA